MIFLLLSQYDNMRLNKTKLLIRLLIILSILLQLSCKPTTQDHKPSLGLAIPLSGSLAWLGTNIQKGVNFYLEQHPDFNNKLQIVVEDVTTTDNARGVAAIKKLINFDQVDALIVANSGALEGSKYEIERSQVVTFGIVGTDAMKGMKYGVKHWVTTQSEARIIVDKIKALNLQRVAIITSEHQGYINREESIKGALQQLQQNNLSLYFERSLGPEDIPSLALKVKKFNPEVVVIVLFPGQVGIFAKELRKLGYAGIFLGTVSASDPADQKIAEGALTGLLYCDVPYNSDFEKAWQEKYREKPLLGSPNGYDIMKILHSALSNNISFKERDALNAFIRVKNFSGAMGTYSFVSDGANTFNFPMTLKTIE